MVNFNGELLNDAENTLHQNRAFLYGDGVFETFRIANGKILFLEDHYFRLMASMRIVRMEIPMNFTMEYLEEQVMRAVNADGNAASARARITVFRNTGGLYKPVSNDVSYLIQNQALETVSYGLGTTQYEVDLYKDFYVCRHLLSTIKTTNKLINITGSIFAEENGLDNCILLNETKNVVEALQGNLFMVQGSRLLTPPVSEGCVKGVMRKQILELAGKLEGIEVAEEIISPFDLQKADELFITNVIIGIQPVTKYRKKEYKSDLASLLTKKLNTFLSEN
jgi:branched-chain amino acid aminotransferase